METKKSHPGEYKSLFPLFKLGAKQLPQCFGYIGEDSYEFELIVEHYKALLNTKEEPCEILVIVSDSGEHAKLFAELFTPDMFFPKKLIILKQGNAFFKPILDQKSNQDWKDYASGFRKNVTAISDKIHFLIHFEGKDLGTSLTQLFQDKLSYFKSKPLYPSDYPKTLKEVSEQEQVILEQNAFDEFIHRSPANLGAYIKNIKKLKSYLHKNKFSLEDVNTVLFSQNEINVGLLVDSFVQRRKQEFFKEFSKYTDQNADILNFLTRLTYRLDEIRKIRIIKSKHRGEIPIPVMDEILKTKGFSDARKNFLRRQWTQEASYFTEKVLEYSYNEIIQINIKLKRGLRNEEAKQFFVQRILALFNILQDKSSS